jgi:nitroimidazol reductase NimA-like FMN-containing flavoprotein (pyridoxamine 5'-phosphate oxidase superfamily)
MAKRFETEQERDAFLREPRLAILMYHGPRPSPTGVPVWFDWDGETLRMFAGRASAKVKRLRESPDISVLVTNRVGEPEGWVAFDGKVSVSDFETEDWHQLIDRVAPLYWDMNVEDYAKEIAGWRSSPESFVSLELTPERIRSGR